MDKTYEFQLSWRNGQDGVPLWETTTGMEFIDPNSDAYVATLAAAFWSLLESLQARGTKLTITVSQ